VTQPPPASPHQWNGSLLLRAARLRRSTRTPLVCFSLSFSLSSKSSRHSRTETDGPLPHGLSSAPPPLLTGHQLSLFLSFSSPFSLSFFLSSPVDRFYLSFFLLFYDSHILFFILLVSSLFLLSFCSVVGTYFTVSVQLSICFTCFTVSVHYYVSHLGLFETVNYFYILNLI
jgi:hypothetical protein